MIKFNAYILLYRILIGPNNDIMIKHNANILLYRILIGPNIETVCSSNYSNSNFQMNTIQKILY